MLGIFEHFITALNLAHIGSDGEMLQQVLLHLAMPMERLLALIEDA